MYKLFTILLTYFGLIQAQQLNCTVSVNAQRLPNSNQQVLEP
jgi:hypothetical protein